MVIPILDIQTEPIVSADSMSTQCEVVGFAVFINSKKLKIQIKSPVLWMHVILVRQ